MKKNYPSGLILSMQEVAEKTKCKEAKFILPK